MRFRWTPVSAATLAHRCKHSFSICMDSVHSWARRKGTSRRLGRSHGKANCAGKEVRMWKKPTIIEIAVGLEINAYACAELD
jgi:coenzyme PQQ precursor peptide PqqA